MPITAEPTATPTRATESSRTISSGTGTLPCLPPTPRRLEKTTGSLTRLWPASAELAEGWTPPMAKVPTRRASRRISKVRATAANEAVADGTEKITRAHLTEITLDTAAEDQYRPALPRQAATAGRRARS